MGVFRIQLQWAVVLVAFVLLGVIPGYVTAQEAAPSVPAKYQLPNSNDVKDYVDFLQNMLSFDPQSPEEANEYQKFAPDAMTVAAQKVMQLDPDQNSDNFFFAQKYLLAVDVMAIDQATDEEKQQLLQLIKRNLSNPKMDADDLDIAVAFAEGLEMIGDTQGAVSAYRDFGGMLKSNKDPVVAELGQLMEGSANRLGLMGNTIQVTGTTFEGQAFNWNAYRGRTVLIDFWATWCGPCRAEFPKIQELYKAYQSRGFEVVGICMDDEREAVEKFMSESKLPWVTLFEPNGQTNPTALRYGVTALPTTILVDKTGRVVSLTARGAELEKQLTQLLGPAQ